MLPIWLVKQAACGLLSDPDKRVAVIKSLPKKYCALVLEDPNWGREQLDRMDKSS